MIKAGQHPEYWKMSNATEEATSLMTSTAVAAGKVIQAETEHLREIVPPGPEHFRAFEHIVRVVFNFLFIGELGEGKAQSRTEPEDEGVEIRDLIFANNSESAFWQDLKRKYAASEIVVDRLPFRTTGQDKCLQSCPVSEFRAIAWCINSHG